MTVECPTFNQGLKSAYHNTKSKIFWNSRLSTSLKIFFQSQHFILTRQIGLNLISFCRLLSFNFRPPLCLQLCRFLTLYFTIKALALYVSTRETSDTINRRGGKWNQASPTRFLNLFSLKNLKSSFEILPSDAVVGRLLFLFLDSRNIKQNENLWNHSPYPCRKGIVVLYYRASYFSITVFFFERHDFTLPTEFSDPQIHSCYRWNLEQWLGSLTSSISCKHELKTACFFIYVC